MNNPSHIKRLAAAVAAGGVVALAPVAMPAANAAPPVACPEYQGFVTTSTTLSVSPANPGVGDAFTVTATVRADGVPADGGTVDFSYAGQTESDTVEAGQASVEFTAVQGSNTVTGTYTGLCSGGADVLGTSADSQPIVAGVEASAGGNGGAARPGANIGGVTGGTGGSGSTSGGLASTGVDSQTELYGLLGIGLVTVGGLTLMVHRRRVQG